MGCAAPETQRIRFSIESKPNEELAVDIVWATYAEYDDEPINGRVPPIIGWINANSFDCGKGWCYGEYVRKHHLALVAWGPLTKYISGTSLAHELCHAWFGDPDHKICINELPPVALANKRLAERGM